MSNSSHKAFHVVLVVSEQNAEWLKRIAEETGRKIEDLMEAAVENETIEYAKSHGWVR